MSNVRFHVEFYSLHRSVVVMYPQNFSFVISASGFKELVTSLFSEGTVYLLLMIIFIFLYPFDLHDGKIPS